MTIRNDNSANFLSDLGLSRPSELITLTASQLMRLIREEREACAKIAEDMIDNHSPYTIPSKIRNRWKNESQKFN